MRAYGVGIRPLHSGMGWDERNVFGQLSVILSCVYLTANGQGDELPYGHHNSVKDNPPTSSTFAKAMASCVRESNLAYVVKNTILLS